MVELVHLVVLLLTQKRVTVSGSTAVAVRCGRCRQKYFYPLTRAVRVSTQSKKQAQALARERLRDRLDEDIDPIPCPHCGWFQSKMVPLLRSWRLRWMLNLGIAGVVGAYLTAFAAKFLTDLRNERRINLDDYVLLAAWALAGLLLLGGLALLFMRWRSNAHYDPNDPETEQQRIEMGRSLTITREEAEALMQQQED